MKLTPEKEALAAKYYPYALSWAWRSSKRDHRFLEELRSACGEAISRAALEHDPSKGGFLSRARFRLCDAVKEVYETAGKQPAWSLSEIDEPHSPDAEPDFISDEVFEHAIQSLCTRERVVLRLLYVEGRSFAEVAKAIGKSKATVAKVSRDAMQTLRDKAFGTS